MLTFSMLTIRTDKGLNVWAPDARFIGHGVAKAVPLEWRNLGGTYSQQFRMVASQRTLSVTVSCGVVKKAFSPARQACQL